MWGKGKLPIFLFVIYIVVIGVSAGVNKVDAILGALRAGLLDVLVTDEDTAEAVLAKAESGE